MTARRKAKGVRRRSATNPPVMRRRVTARAEPRYEEATQRDATNLPPLERDVDSDESTQLGALFDERSRDATKLPPLERDVDSDESTQLGALFDERLRDDGDPIVGDPEGTTTRRFP